MDTVYALGLNTWLIRDEPLHRLKQSKRLSIQIEQSPKYVKKYSFQKIGVESIPVNLFCPDILSKLLPGILLHFAKLLGSKHKLDEPD